jgi:hypothetical protein
MPLVLKDRVQEVTTTSGTGTLTLTGAIAGFQTFSTAIGNGNTTFYTIVDSTTGVWEVGVGTVGAGTLARTTVLANSSGTTTPLNLAGNSSSVFCTYPSEKSVNLDASGNVSPLGTIASGTWQGTTVGVAYGGTGVTTSSGASSVVLRDSNQNIAVNRLNQSDTSTTSAGGTTALTTASSYIQTLIGTSGQTYTMPDATTLATGVAFLFNNRSTGTLTLQDYAAGPLGTITPGGAGAVFLTDNSTVGGTWDLHGYLPEGVTWGTNALNLGTTIISNGTWQGGTIGTAYGGTGLTTFSAADYALYSTSASALVAGTLPVAAGGTGLTTLTTNQIPYGNGTSAFGSSANFVWGSGSNTLRITGALETTYSNITPPTSGGGSVISINNTDTSTSSNSSILFRGTDAGGTGRHAAAITWGKSGAWTAGGGNYGSYLSFSTRADGTDTLEKMRITADGNVGIGTTSPSALLDVNGNVAITGSARRITGDFSNATLANRVAFQTSTVNDNTTVSFIPNGTGTQTFLSLYNNSDSSNSSLGLIASRAATFELAATKTGTGTYLPMTFLTNASERMRIDTSGNVGIGTAAPATKLTVNAATTYSSAGLIPNMVFHTTGESGNNTFFDCYGGGSIGLNGRAAGGTSTSPSATVLNQTLFNFGGRGYGTTGFSALSRSNIGFVAAETWTDTAQGSYITLITTPIGSTTRAERMRIDGSGNVGIGTTVTGAGEGKLNIGSSTSPVNLHLFYGTNGDNYLTCGSSGIQVFRTGSTERMRIDSSGNVGIGTASPANKFVVADGVGEWRFSPSNLTVGSNNSGYATIYCGGLPVDVATASGGAKMFLGGDSRGDSLLNSVAFYRNATESMRIDSSGNLLLGTTTSPAGSKELVLGGDYIEGVVAIGTVGATHTITLANGTVQTATLTSATACTFTMPTAVAGKSFILLLKQPASGTATTATFTGVKYPAAGAPTITATVGKMDILTFVADGTNWYGSYAQGYTP